MLLTCLYYYLVTKEIIENLRSLSSSWRELISRRTRKWENKILKITEKVPVEVTLPDGIYQGTYGGYIINITYKNKNYELTTECGVRGGGFKVVVTIKDGIATFADLNN